VRFDMSMVKRFHIHNSVSFEFRAEMLNVFNTPYFNPSGNAVGSTTFPLGLTSTAFTGNGPSQSGTATANVSSATSADGYRLTSLLGDNTSRIIQLVWRVRW